MRCTPMPVVNTPANRIAIAMSVIKIVFAVVVFAVFLISFTLFVFDNAKIDSALLGGDNNC